MMFKGIFKIAKHLMGVTNTAVYPQHESARDLAEDFNTFFCNKIKVIRDNLDGDPLTAGSTPVTANPPVHGLTNFTPTTPEVLCNIIMSSPSKSCELDPIPAWLLKDCTDEHGSHQSAYRRFHSTETALLKVQTDILEALDRGSGCVLVMLDLSAAFDTLDHDILLDRLRTTFGITGTALSWFRSYVTGRSQAVTIDGAVSAPAGLQYGVPQGSVLGPILYSMYTQPLADVIQQHDVHDHFYADDTQLYHMFTPRDSISLAETVLTLEKAAKAVKNWMVKNKLKLNGVHALELIINQRNSD